MLSSLVLGMVFHQPLSTFYAASVHHLMANGVACRINPKPIFEAAGRGRTGIGRSRIRQGIFCRL
jgi:hypothetical protein